MKKRKKLPSVSARVIYDLRQKDGEKGEPSDIENIDSCVFGPVFDARFVES